MRASVLLAAGLSFGTTLNMTAQSSVSQQAVQSDSFVDSVGVNLHLHDNNTIYQDNYPLVRSSLVTLGVRHVRDGFIPTTWQPYYDRHEELGKLGIKGIFITGPDVPTSVLESWPKNLPDSFEAYENANEFDVNSANWLPLLQSGMPTIYTASKTGASYSVAAPTLMLPDSPSKLGSMGAYLDFGNIHDYFSNFNPGTSGWGDNGYGSIAYNLSLASRVSGTKPVWATETGYNNDSRSSSYVDETVAGIYIPRLLLEHWNAGIKRTYLYELATSSTGQDYGLLRSDGSQKPAFKAVANLLSLLSDKGSGFTPSQLDYTLKGAGSTIHQLLLQKRDGTFYLALWNESPVYDPYQHVPIAVPPQSITLHSSHLLSGVTTYQWASTGDVTTANLADGTDVPLAVADKLLIVKFKVPNSVKLTKNIFPLGAGAITATPESADGNFTSGTSIVLTAKANPGYVFNGYTGDAIGSGSSVALSLVKDTSVTASFTACSFKFGSSTLPMLDNGMLALASTAGVNSIAYSTSTGCSAKPTVSGTWLTATADNGVLTFSATKNAAAYRVGTITLGDAQVNIVQAGFNWAFVRLLNNVPGSWVGADGFPVVEKTWMIWMIGSKHTLSGWTPQNVGGTVYLFNRWVTGVSGPKQVRVTASAETMTYTSELVKGSYLNATSSGGGKIISSNSGQMYKNSLVYKPSDTVTLTAIPDAGCAFTGWLVDSTSTQAELTLSMADSKTLLASFSCTQVGAVAK